MANKLNVTPLHDRVIVRPAKAEDSCAVDADDAGAGLARLADAGL